MKKAKLGNYLLWEKQPAQIIAESDLPQVTIELLEGKRCPHCQGYVGKKFISVVVDSPMFQNNAEQVTTIEDNNKEAK